MSRVLSRLRVAAAFRGVTRELSLGAVTQQSGATGEQPRKRRIALGQQTHRAHDLSPVAFTQLIEERRIVPIAGVVDRRDPRLSPLRKRETQRARSARSAARVTRPPWTIASTVRLRVLLSS